MQATRSQLEELTDSENGETVQKIIRSDSEWNNPERRMLAISIFPDAIRQRELFLHHKKRLDACRFGSAEEDLKILDAKAGQIAELRRLIEQLREDEANLVKSINTLRDGISKADFHRREVTKTTALDCFTKALLRPEYEAVGLHI